jgi:hypothetical protein
MGPRNGELLGLFQSQVGAEWAKDFFRNKSPSKPKLTSSLFATDHYNVQITTSTFLLVQT